MENQIYLVYNKLANRYTGVFSFETDAVAKARLSDPKMNINFDEIDICKVGSFGITDGVITSFAPVRLEIPLKSEPLPAEEVK